MRPAAAREQWAEQQDRAAQPADQRAVGLVLHHVATVNAQGGAANSLDFGPQVEQQAGHHLHVGDARHIGQRARLVGQQARGHQRQRGVLVAFDVDAAAESTAALDYEG